MFRKISLLFLVLSLFVVRGCAKKADPKRSIEKIHAEVVSMPVAELQSMAQAYAEAIRAQKAEIGKIQQKIQKMPMEKVFSNPSLTRRISEIGREAEALFERYRIYVKVLGEKGGDLSKVQIEPGQPRNQEENPA